MSARSDVSEIFDASAWAPVEGFEQLTDLTYHRAVDAGVVRVTQRGEDVDPAVARGPIRIARGPRWEG